jgi:hypothetical protein
MRVHIIDAVRRRHPLRVMDFRFTRQYWYPVVLARSYLKETGVDVRFFGDITEKSLDCDVVVLSSRHHDHLFGTAKSPEKRASSVEVLAGRTKRLIWFDLRDSSGTPQFEVLPYVSLYAKQMLLKDLRGYSDGYYGGRVFADYFHRHFGIADAIELRSDDQEDRFTPLDPKFLSKIVLSWDVSYDYRRHWRGPADQLAKSLQEGWRLFADRPPVLDFHPPAAPRAYDLSAMLSVNRYARETVAYQRRVAMREVKNLAGHVFAERVPRRKFIETLRNSKIILSCFGNGEVCYREHEAWVAGAAVIMPDMSHLRIWPDRYRDGKTYRAVAWGLEDLAEKYDELRESPTLRQELAESGQDTMRAMFSEGGIRALAERFKTIMECKDPDLGLS